jgi:hypothetical protein
LAKIFVLSVVGFLKKQSAFNVPALLLLGFLLKVSFITEPLAVEIPSSGGLLDKWLYESVWLKLNPVFLAAITVLILLISALYLNVILTQKRMLARNQFLPVLSFILFTSIFAGLQKLHAGVLLLPLTVLLYGQMIALYQSSKPRTIVVNIGLITGFSFLLYHPYWWLLLCCFWALAQMRPFRATEWMLLLVSFLTPAYFLLSYEYLTDQWNPSAHWPVWNPMQQWPPFNPWWITALVAVALWFIIGLTNWQNVNRRMLIQTRKNWYILLMMGVFILPTLFFPKGNLLEGLTLLSLPFSAIGAYAFAGDNSRKWQSLLFWLLLILAIASSWAVHQGLM